MVLFFDIDATKYANQVERARCQVIDRSWANCQMKSYSKVWIIAGVEWLGDVKMS